MEQKLNTAYFSPPVYIMVLRVLQLEPEDRDYILEFIDHTQDMEEGD